MAVSAGVTSSVDSGSYTTAQTVALSTTEETGVIHYTVDGNTPTSESTTYTAPIALAAGTKTYIKAITVTDGKDNSAVLTVYITVDESYLTKIRRACRANTDADTDAELTDIIDECRLDLQSVGVVSAKTSDETDALILGAVRSFARWKFGVDEKDAAANRADYMIQRDELRRKRDYATYAITFVVTADSTPIPDAVVTFNGETQETNASGTAVFYYVGTGVNQEYTASATGYVSQVGDLDVTATATVNVAMTAG